MTTETLKKAGFSKLGCRVVFLKYLSMDWNSSVQSADQSKLYFISSQLMATLL